MVKNASADVYSILSSMSMIKLNPRNFTTLSETPWAGSHLAGDIKKMQLSQGTSAGESWEISTDPRHPSLSLENAQNLSDLVKEVGPAFLGSTCHQGVEILFKYVSTARPLSVQVHPADDDPRLKSTECGKPESWYILDCKPSSGVYIGFKEGFTKEQLSEILEQKKDLSPFLNFIPVSKGDYFELLPNVVHALGEGLLLAEPQRILSGKSGKTLRLWDWNRLYNSGGELSENGKPRDLHISEGLSIVDPSLQCGAQFLKKIKLSARIQDLGFGATAQFFPRNPYFQFIVVTAKEEATIEASQECYSGFVVSHGRLTVMSHCGESMTIARGESAVLGAGSFPLKIAIEKGSEFYILNPADHNLALISRDTRPDPN